jgi:hypothetical protein
MGDDHVDVFESSCPNHPFYEELGDTKINTQILGVLAHGAVLNLSTSPLSEGVDSPCISPLRTTFSYLCQFWFLNVCVLTCKVSGVFTAPHGGSPYLWMW